MSRDHLWSSPGKKRKLKMGWRDATQHILNTVFFFSCIIISRLNLATIVESLFIQHDINFEEDSEKNPSRRWDLNPRPSVLETLWWARANLRVSTGTASRGYTAKLWLAHKNSLTASRCRVKAYPRCGQPTSKVSILKMKQQQHDIYINLLN